MSITPCGQFVSSTPNWQGDKLGSEFGKFKSMKSSLVCQPIKEELNQSVEISPTKDDLRSPEKIIEEEQGDNKYGTPEYMPNSPEK